MELLGENKFVPQDENRPRLYSETIQKLREDNQDIVMKIEEAGPIEGHDFSMTARARETTFHVTRTK